MKKRLFPLMGLIVLVSVSCTKDKTPIEVKECPEVISFATQIKPVIELNCSTSGCHDASGSGGYVFLTYNDILLHADNILKAIRHDSGTNPMPLGADKLPDSIAQQMNCWITQGKLNN